MENEEYYITIGENQHNVKGVLTAKLARQMTNEAIIEKVNKELLPMVEKKAKLGCFKVIYTVSRKVNIDFSVLQDYIKSLGYNIEKTETYADYVDFYIKW